MTIKTKYSFYYMLLLLTLVGFLGSCSDDEVSPVALTVKLHYPADYSVLPGEGISIEIRSTTGGPSYSATSHADGTALFESVLPGTYELSATQSLDAEQALAITGKFNEAITLNGQTQITVLPQATGQLFNIELSGVPSGTLVFKEVYYTGVPNIYFSDQFIEIYNNTNEVIYLDKLCIADIYGVSGQINDSSIPTPFRNDINHVYANSVWQIPGSGQDHPLLPGQSIIIAQDGIDHRQENSNSTVDLSQADWETYNERDDNRDIDSPTVPNLTRLYFTGGFDWLLPVFGPAIVIFRVDDFSTLEQVSVPDVSPTFAPRIKIPNSLVIDTFEALRDAQSGAFMRIPASLDAGFVFASNTYTGESFRRKLATTEDGRKILQDTNNSGNDFIKLSTPTPRQLP